MPIDLDDKGDGQDPIKAGSIDLPKGGRLGTTWCDPRLHPGQSQIHGTGLVAADGIEAGEVVMIWGGTVYTRAELEAGDVPPCSFSFIGEDLLLAAPADGLDYYVNQSCDPVVWMRDEVTVVARRRIVPGEEITGDYAIWEAENDYVMEQCSCQAASCRGRVTGRDWRRPELQARYAGHFLPYIQQRIDFAG